MSSTGPAVPHAGSARALEWPRVAHPRPLVLALSLLLVAAIAVADALTGYEIRLGILYLVPIALTTWSIGRAPGIALAFAAGACWLFSFHESHAYSHVLYYYWEAVLTIASYVIFVLLLASLRSALARSDDRFVTVLDGMDAAVFVEDARTSQVLFANPRYREMFGARRPNVLTDDASRRGPGEIYDEPTQRWLTVRSQPLRWIDGREVTLRLLSDVTEEKRVRELLERGMPAHFEDVLLDLQARDARDTSRASAPLAQAADADVLDTSDMDVDEAIAEAIRLVEARLKAKAPS